MARAIVATQLTSIPSCDVDRYQSWLERHGFRSVSVFQSRKLSGACVLFTDGEELARYRAGTLEQQYLSGILG